MSYCYAYTHLNLKVCNVNKLVRVKITNGDFILVIVYLQFDNMKLKLFSGVSSLESELSNCNIYLEKIYFSDSDVLLSIQVK